MISNPRTACDSLFFEIVVVHLYLRLFLLEHSSALHALVIFYIAFRFNPVRMPSGWWHHLVSPGVSIVEFGDP